MFLTVHAVAGEVLAQSTTSPLVAFVIGFISHFFVDALPHGDETIGERTREQTIRLLIVVALTDLAFVFATQALLWKSGILVFSFSVFCAAFGAMFPDALQLPYYLFKNPPPIVLWYKQAHVRFHNFLGIRLGIKWGLAFQSLTFLLLINFLR